jgi:hypothetical protein
VSATVHAYIQLATVTAKDKLSVRIAAHLTLELSAVTAPRIMFTPNHSEHIMTPVVTFLRLKNVSLDLDDTALTLRGRNIGRSNSVNDLLCSSY